MASKRIRIGIPNKVEDQLKLSKLIYQKHVADGKTSILNTMEDHKWDDLGPNIEPALTKHLEAEELRRKMEQAYKDRDRMMGDVESSIKSTRDFLKGVYSKQPKKLGEYGYSVDDSPKAKPVKADKAV
jgi:gamma-glutamyltranspeptidase